MGDRGKNRLRSMKKQYYIKFPQGKPSLHPNGSGLERRFGDFKELAKCYCLMERKWTALSYFNGS